MLGQDMGHYHSQAACTLIVYLIDAHYLTKKGISDCTLHIIVLKP